MKQNRSKLSSDEAWLSHQAAWEALKDTEEGQEVIFEHIEIARDGGLGDISKAHKRRELPDYTDRLWYNTRPISTLVAFVFIFYNMYFILNNAKNVIYGQDVKWTDFTLEKLKEIFEGSAHVHQDYLVSTYLLGWVLNAMHASTEWDALLSSCVVILEVLMLVAVIVWTMCRLFQASFFACLCCTCCGKQRWKRWFYIAGVFFDTVPSLQSFSAMRLLYYIVPQVATQHIFNILFYTESHKLPWLVWFIVSRAFCLLVGLDCFLIKYRGVESAIVNQPKLEIQNLMNAAIFLNQVLGVVQLSWAVRDRLYRFVFGGEDGVMTHSEVVRRDIWEAKVAQGIWKTYPCWKAFSIMMTWSDDDFQVLILRDVPEDERASRRIAEYTSAQARGAGEHRV